MLTLLNDEASINNDTKYKKNFIHPIATVYACECLWQLTTSVACLCGCSHKHTHTDAQ